MSLTKPTEKLTCEKHSRILIGKDKCVDCEREMKNKFYLDEPLEVNCDEDGETFICYGTKSKLKAFQAIKDFADSECGLDEECLPKIKDLEISKLWYGSSEVSSNEDWYWWGNPPKSAKYLGLCWKYKVTNHD